MKGLRWYYIIGCLMTIRRHSPALIFFHMLHEIIEHVMGRLYFVRQFLSVY